MPPCCRRACPCGPLWISWTTRRCQRPATSTRTFCQACGGDASEKVASCGAAQLGMQMVPEAADEDFWYVDRLLKALSRLISETAWSESDQGQFVRLMTGDVFEFASTIRAEAQADRWTVSVVLIRPMQERSIYALAAAIEPQFSNEYEANLRKEMKEMEERLANKATGKGKKKRKRKGGSRLMVQRARGIIDHWAKESRGRDDFLQESIYLYQLVSRIQHHHTGWSQQVQMSRRDRIEVISTIRHSLEEALAGAVNAVEVMGADGTRAWHRAHSLVAPFIRN